MPTLLPDDWTMKDISTAQTYQGELADGRIELKITHDILHGVMPEMLVWWFQHIHENVVHEGEEIPVYRFWHPHDHIRVRVRKPAPDGAPGFSSGAVVEINERIVRQLRLVARVARMDTTGINLIIRKGGKTVGDLRHTFTEKPEGTLYQSRLVIGPQLPIIGKAVNRLVTKRVFTLEMARAWLKHNIEEVGNFEAFLPELYARAQVA